MAVHQMRLRRHYRTLWKEVAFDCAATWRDETGLVGFYRFDAEDGILVLARLPKKEKIRDNDFENKGGFQYMILLDREQDRLVSLVSSDLKMFEVELSSKMRLTHAMFPISGR